MPAKAGIQLFFQKDLDSRLRGNERRFVSWTSLRDIRAT
jgi:hypothetical protein